MTVQELNINPNILVWAREQAGYSLDDGARALGFKDTNKTLAIDKLQAFEIGDRKPTRKQLENFAKTYRRPITTFYLTKPPIVASKGEDFRRPDQPLSSRERGLLDALLRDVKARQDMVRSIIEDSEDSEQISFVGSLSIDTSVQDAAKILRSALKFDPENNGVRNSPSKLFSEFRTRVEELGVFVLLIGNLGSHHTNINESVFRGFAIADKFAPFIVINDQDAETARVFTLIHELTHLYVGASGVSGEPSVSKPRNIQERIERFCNDVASEFLFPATEIERLSNIITTTNVEDIISNSADKYGVSQFLVAYRLWRANQISTDKFNQLSNIFRARWMAAKAKKKTENRDKGGSGPSYYIVKRHRIGDAMLDLVGRTMRGGDLTHTKAAKLLGTSITSVDSVLSKVRSFAGSASSKEKAI